MSNVSQEVDTRIPVTVLTGFLGAGKTTLLNHVMTADHGEKIAVIINEFGEVGIDNQLVVGADEEIFEMNNGWKLELDPDFLEDHDHEHDDDVKSLFFREERPLDLDKLEQFLKVWLTEHGADTLRYKGVLQIKGVEQRVIFQGVHMLFASAPDRKWKPSEVPISEFVIIGRNLDEDWFKSAFAGCVA